VHDHLDGSGNIIDVSASGTQLGISGSDNTITLDAADTALAAPAGSVRAAAVTTSSSDGINVINLDGNGNAISGHWSDSAGNVVSVWGDRNIIAAPNGSRNKVTIESSNNVISRIAGDENSLSVLGGGGNTFDIQGGHSDVRASGVTQSTMAVVGDSNQVDVSGAINDVIRIENSSSNAVTVNFSDSGPSRNSTLTIVNGGANAVTVAGAYGLKVSFNDEVGTDYRFPPDEFELLEIKAAFSSLDISGDGTIDTEELGIYSSSVGEDLTEPELQGLIAEVDGNDSGQIELDEFAVLIANTNRPASASTG
jgi:hypothetical protein